MREKGIWYQNMDPAKWVETYPRCSMFDQFRVTAHTYPELPAIDFQGKQYTFRQVTEKIAELAHSLSALGIQTGDIVSVVSPNVPQAVIMIYALNKIGAIANMIHPLLSTKEIQHFVESTNSKAVLVLDVIYERIAPIEWNSPCAPKVIIAQLADVLPLHLRLLYQAKKGIKIKTNSNHDTIFWRDLLKFSPIAEIVQPERVGDPDAVAVILYSGGTTGVQKGVMLTNYNMTCYAIQAFEASGMDTVGKKCLCVLPLFHGFGLALCVHTMLCAGTCIYLVPTYNFQKCNTLIFRKKLNFLCGVPAFFEALSRYPDMDKKDLSFIDCLISGGDVLPAKLQKRINKQLKAGGSKAEIREAYGQTESVTGCCINPDFHNVIGSVGLPCPDIQSKIVALGTQKEVPVGTDGELCLTGPNLMLGYYKNQEATDKVLQCHPDGKIWLHTGDIFSKDENGYLYFRQRMSRMIVSAGYNIYLSSIEDSLRECGIVKNVCAVGIHNRILGSTVGVYIILNEKIDQQKAHKQILDYCKQNIADYALPNRVIFVDEFPLTKMGKTDYVALEKAINT